MDLVFPGDDVALAVEDFPLLSVSVTVADKCLCGCEWTIIPHSFNIGFIANDGVRRRYILKKKDFCITFKACKTISLRDKARYTSKEVQNKHSADDRVGNAFHLRHPMWAYRLAASGHQTSRIIRHKLRAPLQTAFERHHRQLNRCPCLKKQTCIHSGSYVAHSNWVPICRSDVFAGSSAAGSRIRCEARWHYLDSASSYAVLRYALGGSSDIVVGTWAIRLNLKSPGSTTLDRSWECAGKGVGWCTNLRERWVSLVCMALRWICAGDYQHDCVVPSAEKPLNGILIRPSFGDGGWFNDILKLELWWSFCSWQILPEQYCSSMPLRRHSMIQSAAAWMWGAAVLIVR